MSKMKSVVSILVSLCMICSFIAVSAAEELQEHTLFEGNVRLLGRGEFLDDGYRTFNWPNNGFEFKFTGTKAEVDLVVVNGVLANVQIDGGEPDRILLTNGWNTLCSGLEAGVEHTIRFVRASESHAGTFKAKMLRTDAKPEPTVALDKKIEFIGDSYTSGYANVYTGAFAYDTHYDTDNWYSYPAYVARMIDDYNIEDGTYDNDFGAEFNVTAHQGKGLYVNGTDPNNPMEYTMTKEFTLSDVYMNSGSGKLSNMSTGAEWNFARYQPQLVVIFIGTNDVTGSHYAKKLGVEDVPLAFENAYVDFLNKVKSVYPETTILCISKPSGSYGEEAQKAIARVGGAAADIHFLNLTSFKGTSLAHPSKTEAEDIAKQVVEKIYEIDDLYGIWSKTETSDETISIRADYNTGDIYVYGNTGNADDYVSALVLKPETSSTSVKDEDVKHISQAITDPNGDYDFAFNMGAVEGGYTFYMNSLKTGEKKSKAFEFTSYIPQIILNDGETKVDKISDIKGDSLDVTIKGFDFEDGFKGVVIVSQYAGDKMVGAKTIEASESSVACGDEITGNVSLEDGVDTLRVVYINTSTYAPIIGKYEIK